MKTKKLIITLTAIMFVSFSITPAANAGVFVAPLVYPVAAVFYLVVGLMGQDKHEANEDHLKNEAAANEDHQKNEAAADDIFRDNRTISKDENRWAD